MNTERSHLKRLLFLISIFLSQEAFAVPIMTTGQSGSDILVRAHNFENRNYSCTVQFSWTGNGMSSNVKHNSISIVPADTINLIIVNHQTALANVRITSGPIMICRESA
jgi:hypothetical protein